MMRLLLTRLLLAATTLLLAACCGSVACDCQDGQADSVALRFDLTAPNGFLPAEVDSVYLRRVPLDTARIFKPDSVLLVRTAAQARQPVIIGNTAPLPLSGTRKINPYRYVLRLASRRKPTAAPVHPYSVSRIELAGNVKSDGCCTCYQNTKKLLTVDRRAYDQTIAGRDTVVLTR